MSVVGFDFGNLNCVICAAKRGGIETVLNEGSKRMTTNAVSFQGNERFLGEGAVPLMRSNFKNTLVEMKRFIGKNYSDAEVQKDIARLPNKDFVEKLEGDRIGLKFTYNGTPMVLSPEDIAAMLLGQLKETAQRANAGTKVVDCVISVPAYFTDRQRRAIKNAARIAKLNALRILNDNTASALAFGIWKSARNLFDETKKQRVMFVDVGHSNYQVSVVSFVQGKLEVEATVCDPHFGGRVVDDLLVDHFSEEFKAKFNLDPRTNPKALITLRKTCEKAKTTLTPAGVTKANLNAEFLMEEKDFRGELTYEQLSEMLAPYKESVAAPIKKALEQLKLTPTDISSVEIIGGASRPRFVKQTVAEVMELDQTKNNYGLSTTLNADESVARGCALMCAMLSPAFRVKEFTVQDICYYPIRISWDQAPSTMSVEGEEEQEDTNSTVIFDAGDELPKKRRVTFKRDEPFDITVEYDESATPLLPPGYDRQLGKYTIKGMPNENGDAPPAKIRVNFLMNMDGVFTVESSQCLQEVEEETAPVPEAPAPKTETPAPEAPVEGEGEGAKEAKAQEGEGEKMETDTPKDEDKEKEGEAAAAPAPAPTPEAQKKKKFKKITLQVNSEVFGGLSSTELANAEAREQEFIRQDVIIRETGEARNALEEYIYKMRNMIDAELKDYTTEEEKTGYKQMLEESESWLYDEGSDEKKQVYIDRLSTIRVVGDKGEMRKRESEQRPEAIKAFSASLEDFLRVVNSSEEKYAHLEDADREKVRKQCTDAQAWLDEKLSALGDQDLNQDPTVTVAEMQSKVFDVSAVCKPVVNKRAPPPPAPKEEKKEEKKEEEKMDEPEAKQTEGEENAEMKTDAPADEETPSAEVNEEGPTMEVD